MQLTNGEIFRVKPALDAVLNLPADRLSWRGKYFMAKLGRILSGPLADIEATRVKLVQEYGEKTTTGFTVPPGERTNRFQAEYAEVLGVAVELDWSCVILTEKDADALTGGEVMLLAPFVTFPEPSPAAPNGTIKAPLELVK